LDEPGQNPALEKPPSIPQGELAAAEEVLGLRFSDAERALLAENVTEHRGHYEKMRAIPIENDVPPAFRFDPRLPGMTFDMARKPLATSKVRLPSLPSDLEEIAFWPITHLAELIWDQQIPSVGLTEMYLRRLKRY